MAAVLTDMPTRLADRPPAVRQRQQQQKQQHDWANVVAGATAGVVSAVITCPLDVAKTRLQNQRTGDAHYRGTVGTLRTIYLEEGIRGWYRGLTASMLGYLPNWAVYFTAYERFKHLYSEHFQDRTDTRLYVVSAMSAGAVSTVVTNPFWVVKTRLITQTNSTNYHYTGPLNAFPTIIRLEGWHGLYRGLVPSLLGVSHVTVQFPIYERLKTMFLEHRRKTTGNPNAELTSVHILTASAVSKVCASVCTYPHEVLRTRLHNQTEKVPKYRGLLNTARIIVAEEGVRGLYKGMLTNLFRVTPAGAITFLTYETMARHLRALFPDQNDA